MLEPNTELAKPQSSREYSLIHQALNKSTIQIVRVTESSPVKWLEKDRKQKFDRLRGTPILLKHPDGSTSFMQGTGSVLLASFEEPVLSVQHTFCSLIDATIHNGSENLRASYHAVSGNSPSHLGVYLRSFLSALRDHNLVPKSVRVFHLFTENAGRIKEVLDDVSEQNGFTISPIFLFENEDTSKIIEFDLLLEGVQGYSVHNVRRMTQWSM